MARYIVNAGAAPRVIHDSYSLREQCNTDQIKERGEIRTAYALTKMIQEGFRLCEHCFSSRDEQEVTHDAGPQ